MRKKIIGIISIAMLLVITAGCSKSSEAKKTKATDWAKIEEKGEIVIGIDDTFVPMGFKDDEGNLTGFDIELARMVTKELGIKPKFQTIEWNMKETELNNGTIDVIWNGYTTSSEREKKVAFTNTYFDGGQILVSLKKNKIDSYEKMKDKRLGVQDGSSAVTLLEENPEVLLDFVENQEPVLFSNNIEAFLDLDNERIDGLLVGGLFAEYYLTSEGKKDNYTIVRGDFPKQEMTIGVRKEDKETVKKLNEGLKAVYDSGEAGKLSIEWFGDDKVVPQK